MNVLGCTAPALSCLCLLLCGYQARVLSRLECECTAECRWPQAERLNLSWTYFGALAKLTHCWRNRASPKSYKQLWRDEKQPEHGQRVEQPQLALLPTELSEQEMQVAECLCVEVSCLGAALASASSALLCAVEAPIASWAVGSSLTSFLASRWLMGVLPWEVVASHALQGWPSFLVSSPYALLAAASAASVLAGCLLARARRAAN